MRVSSFCPYVARLFVLCFVVLVLAGIVAPQVVFAAAQGGDTRIVSQKMVYDSERNQVVFEGKVHVTRPDMEIWTDKLTMTLDNSGKAAAAAEGAASLGMQGGKVERIIAEKNVRIKQENKTGTCGKATYFVNEGKIFMEQDPVIVDGDNRIRGRVITFYTDTGRSEVTGNVDVRFTTEEGKANPFTAPQQPSSTRQTGRRGATQ